MTKELFIESINALRKQSEIDSKCARALWTILPDNFVGACNNSVLHSQLVKVLQVEMDDDTDESWIDSFIDTLDFGKLWKPGKIVMDGKDVRLETPEDLWDLLTSDTLQNKE
jgi:hypothetical protein